MKNCDDGYPSCRQAEATGEECKGACKATQEGPVVKELLDVFEASRSPVAKKAADETAVQGDML